jgi:signal transduction protein with GAF and PtsI domain
MAARPELAIALLALGIDALSVTPRAIPELKRALAQVALEPLRASIDEVLAASTAEDVATALGRYTRQRRTYGDCVPASCFGKSRKRGHGRFAKARPRLG